MRDTQAEHHSVALQLSTVDTANVLMQSLVVQEKYTTY